MNKLSWDAEDIIHHSMSGSAATRVSSIHHTPADGESITISVGSCYKVRNSKWRCAIVDIVAYLGSRK